MSLSPWDTQDLLTVIRLDAGKNNSNSSSSSSSSFRINPDTIVLELLKAKLDSLTMEKKKDIFRQPDRNVPPWYAFSLKNEYDRQAAIIVTMKDAFVSKVKPSMVPKEMKEETFYANYFSYVIVFLNTVLSSPRRPTVSESKVLEEGKPATLSVSPINNLRKHSSTNSVDIASRGRRMNSMEKVQSRQSFQKLGLERSTSTDFSAPRRNSLTALVSLEMLAKLPADSLLFRILSSIGSPRMSDVFLTCLQDLYGDDVLSNWTIILPSREEWTHLKDDISGLSNAMSTFTDEFDNKLDPTVYESTSAKFFCASLNEFEFIQGRDSLGVEILTSLDPGLVSAYSILVPNTISHRLFYTRYLRRVVSVAFERFGGFLENQDLNDTPRLIAGDNALPEPPPKRAPEFDNNTISSEVPTNTVMPSSSLQVDMKDYRVDDRVLIRLELVIPSARALDLNALKKTAISVKKTIQAKEIVDWGKKIKIVNDLDKGLVLIQLSVLVVITIPMIDLSSLVEKEYGKDMFEEINVQIIGKVDN